MLVVEEGGCMFKHGILQGEILEDVANILMDLQST